MPLRGTCAHYRTVLHNKVGQVFVNGLPYFFFTFSHTHLNNAFFHIGTGKTFIEIDYVQYYTEAIREYLGERHRRRVYLCMYSAQRNNAEPKKKKNIATCTTTRWPQNYVIVITSVTNVIEEVHRGKMSIKMNIRRRKKKMYK